MKVDWRALQASSIYFFNIVFIHFNLKSQALYLFYFTSAHQFIYGERKER